MTRFLKMLLAAVSLELAMLASAAAQVPAGLPCANRAEVVEHLGKIFGERQLGRGLADSGVVIELFAGPEGSFTIFATTPRGRSCFIASGEGWEPPPPQESFAAR